MSKLFYPRSASTEEITMLVEKFAEEKKIEVKYQEGPSMETVAGCLLVGASAVVGGLLFGPRGIAFGGALGATAVTTVGQEVVISLAEALRRMNFNLKQQLAELVRRVILRYVHDFTKYCVDTLLTKILGNSKFLSEIKAVINFFLQQRMNAVMLQ